MFDPEILAIITLGLVLIGQILYRRRVWFFQSLDDQVLNRRFVKMLKWFWLVSASVILSIQVYWSVLQYQTWKIDPFSKFFLPPYQDISYFLGYVGVRFFGPWILAFMASLLFSWIARFLNKKFDERFFEKEEIELVALGTFLVGWPGFSFYLGVILVFGALISIFYQIFTKGRLPLYYFWMPFAISAIIIKVKFLYVFGIAGFWGQFSLGDFYKLFFGY